MPGEESSDKIWSEFQRLLFKWCLPFWGHCCTEMGDVIKRRLYKLKKKWWVIFSRARRSMLKKSNFQEQASVIMEFIPNIGRIYYSFFPVLSSIFYSKKPNLSSVFLFQKAKSIFCPGVLNLIIQARNARVFIGTGIARCQVS